MPSLTREEAKLLGRRAQQPTRAPGELLAIFVAGALSNPMNATWGHWKRRRWATQWKQRVALALFEAGWTYVPGAVAAYSSRDSVFPVHVARHKRVTFTAHVFNHFDDDNLGPALKPVRDALVECGVISGDADRDGHEFVYTQVIDRARRGVEIRISLR